MHGLVVPLVRLKRREVLEIGDQRKQNLRPHISYLDFSHDKPEALHRADTARNQDPWYEAFSVKAGQKLYLAPAERVRVW